MIYRISYTDRKTNQSGVADHDNTAARLDDKHFLDCHRYRVQFEDIPESNNGDSHGSE